MATAVLGGWCACDNQLWPLTLMFIVEGIVDKQSHYQFFGCSLANEGDPRTSCSQESILLSLLWCYFISPSLWFILTSLMLKS